MARIAPLMLLPPLAFAALAATFLWGMNRDDPGSVPSAMIGRQAPPVPATTLPGKTQLTDAMLREPGVKLVNFWASWCGPCRMLSPLVDEIAEENSAIKVGKVNVDEQPELAQKFDVMSIPMLVAFKDGKAVNSSVGVQPKENILALLK